MREFSTQISNALHQGIKPFPTREDNAFLDDLKGFLPFEAGVRPWVQLQQVLDIEDELYPMPQVFDFEKRKLVLTGSAVYWLDSSYLPFELNRTQISEWGLSSFFSRYHAVSYDDNFFLTSPEGSVWGHSGEVGSTNKVKANAMIKHRTRTVFGGVQNGFFPEHVLSTLKHAVGTELPLELGGNFIVWSSYEGLDFPFGLVDEELFIPHLGTTEWLETNEFGWIALPEDYDVLALASFRGNIVAFTSESTYVLAESGESPGAGYGIVEEVNHGIYSRHAFGSTEAELVYIDSHGNLRMLAQDAGGLLGFKEEMSKLKEEIFITKHPSEDIWYIGDQNISYALVEKRKLCRINQTIQWIDENGLQGNAYKTSPNNGVIDTGKIDIGIPALKTLTGVSLGTDSTVFKNASLSVEATVRDKKISRTDIPFNYEGYVWSRLFGNNHRITIDIEDISGLHIDYIELKWQIDDNRYRRGTYVTQDVT